MRHLPVSHTANHRFLAAGGSLRRAQIYPAARGRRRGFSHTRWPSGTRRRRCTETGPPRQGQCIPVPTEPPPSPGPHPEDRPSTAAGLWTSRGGPTWSQLHGRAGFRHRAGCCARGAHGYRLGKRGSRVKQRKSMHHAATPAQASAGPHPTLPRAPCPNHGPCKDFLGQLDAGCRHTPPWPRVDDIICSRNRRISPWCSLSCCIAAARKSFSATCQ